MNKIILATRNRGKIREISEILDGLVLEIKSLGDFPSVGEVVEDGATFRENALIKARTVFSATGIPALADDSGLEVYSLNMAPGVLSARFAGEPVSYEENNRKLLAMMDEFPHERRGARFRCVTAFVTGSAENVAEGVCPGRICREARGTGGFGYDPLFVPDGYEMTFAELPADIKNLISHRAKALGSLRKILEIYSKT